MAGPGRSVGCRVTALAARQSEMPIRLVLADDHPIVLEGLAQLFAAEKDFNVVARASNGDAALAAIRRHEPDVVVLDLRMPVKDGLAVLREIRREGLLTRVVVLTATSQNGDVFEAISLEELEKKHILRTLEHTDWNKSQAATILQIERSTLDRKIKSYGLKKDES